MKIKKDLLVTAMALWPVGCHALELLLQPDFRFKERYEDNLRLQPKPSRDNWISTVSPSLTFGYLADNNELKSSFRWNELIYHGESELDFSEKIAGINHLFNGERFKTDISANYAKESSINTQLDLTGSGDVQTLVPRNTKSIAPNISYSLTEKDTVQFSFSYVDVAFDRKPNLTNAIRYSDYDNTQYSATVSHVFNEQFSGNISASYAEFNSGNGNIPIETRIFVSNGSTIIPITISGNQAYAQKSQTLTYQAGMQYTVNETTQIALSAGLRDTNTQSSSLTRFPGFPTNSTEQSSSTIGHVFSANLLHAEEWGNLNLSAGQQLNPASSGTQQQSTTFGLQSKYNLTERLSAGFNANYLISESQSTLNSANTNTSRTYLTISPNLRWRWTEDIDLDLSYTYRDRTYESLNQTSIGNGLQLQFSYQPQINRQVK
ncbi:MULTISPECIES: hypothetical protein [Methylomonas]|uniref:TIGR03016 family PEP-CTERM system-associated outer membrane protein n=1 Tax=Methylomonas koyamae TaxID=702114 RepID=A0A177NX15_9GAMM|nr:hypothetical protein [Methylomonas koyamae]OAI21803.1 hypothetical protein A1355_23015 [Methylomonas koyamae]